MKTGYDADLCNMGSGWGIQSEIETSYDYKSITYKIAKQKKGLPQI